MKIAIHYNAVKTTRESSQVWGVQVAILAWIEAYLAYGTQEQIPFLVGDSASLAEIQDLATQQGVDSKRIIPLDARFPCENLKDCDIVFRADPDPLDLFWQRAYAPQANFAFCGLAHALAGIEAGQLLEKYALSPSHTGDAIICPSRAIQSVIKLFWESYAEFIAQRFNGTFLCPVDLPVIPLGLHAEKITKTLTPHNRQNIRAALDVDDAAILLLWVGRLSSANKAHPLPMFQAAELAAQKTGKKVVFAMQGYFQPEAAEKEFTDLARDICPTVRTLFIKSTDPRFPQGLWAGADIFLSLIDNVQESFGLTPIEAIAAGLPRVLSDWNGYKDCVTHGQDGFLVPTSQPPIGTGSVLSSLVLGHREMYGGVLAKTAQSIAIDIPQAAAYLVELINNPSLRLSFAEKAKERLPTYHWKSIIQQHEALWGEQKERRAKVPQEKNWKTIPPQAPDPFTLYQNYPTSSLSLKDRFCIKASASDIRMLWRHPMNVLSLDLMIPAQDIMVLLNQIAHQKSATPSDMLQFFPAHDPNKIWRTLAWLYKLGILEKQGVSFLPHAN